MFLLEICAANELSQWQDALEKEGFDVVVYDCLDRCETCILCPYAFANGALVERSEVTELLDALREQKRDFDAQMEEWL